MRMDRIAVIGVSLHGTDVVGLEGIRRPLPEEREAFLRSMCDQLGASEVVYLTTCNRAEVIYAREEGESPSAGDIDLLAALLATSEEGDMTSSLVFRGGRDAVSHLFRVTSSLDSLVVGEDQIIGQVREAYGSSADFGLVGTLLGPLFHHALAVGKQVRTDTELARHPVSVVSLALAALEKNLHREHPQIAIVGAGEIGYLIARMLTESKMPPAVIVNRSVEHAQPIAEECGSQAISLEAFRRGEVPVDAIVSATSSQEIVLDGETLCFLAEAVPGGGRLLAVDLAVPRDLAEVESDKLQVIGMDDLRSTADQNRALRAEAAVVAEQMVEAKVDVFSQRLGEQAAGSVLGELKGAADELMEKELVGLLGGRLGHLSEEDKRAVERWARSTFGRVMHLPMEAIKRMASEAQEDQK